MKNHRLHTFATTGEMAKAAAEEFTLAARQAIDERGRFVAVLPGGSTPRRVFSLLTTPMFSDQIDWPRVHLVPSDERLVSPSDPASNSRMIREELFDNLGLEQGQQNFYPPVFDGGLTSDGGMTPEDMALDWETRLRTLFATDELVDDLPTFDFALLGMGSDGHTASLFPGDTALEERTRWCVAVAPRGEPAVARATLTLPVLSRSRAVCFIATGAEKSSVIRRITDADRALPEFPASLVATTGEISWMAA